VSEEGLGKATRAALERYRRQGWTVQAPVLVNDVRKLERAESRDRRQARAGGLTFVVKMSPPEGDLTVHGYGGTPEEAAADALAQAGQSGG
jgi:hypothetical protein